jgi:NAD(P)-dependent dehydrogenase (short-subunit alcohol dehydrogenase family)
MLLWILVVVLVLLAVWAILRLIRTRRYSLRDKVVLITGGSRGLGLVLARQICAAGGKVALIARDPEELGRAKADLAGRGGAQNAFAVQCDLLDPEQSRSAVRQIIDHFGKIDILINNAGIIEVGPLEYMTQEDFERAMRLHFWAPFKLITQIVPEMRRWGGGRIVNISSIGGKVAVPHLAPYSASKFALTGFSAARKILAACRRGQPSLTLTFAARTAILGNALFPNLTGYWMQIVNRFLPKAGDHEANESRAGSQTRRLLPAWLTYLADEATKRNNEGPRKIDV